MLGPLHYLVGSGGVALGLTLAGIGGWAYDGLIDDPAVVRDTRKTCAAEASWAAMEATITQWTRNQKKIDELNRQFDALSIERERAQALTTRELLDEIAAFEAAGRSAGTVTDDNIDFLRP